MKAIVDRDYLTDEEIKQLKNTYPFLSVLPYYSIENLLYHPDNLLEYYESKGKAFEKSNYIKALETEKNNELNYICGGITKARDGYPFFRENEFAKLLQTFKGNFRSIIDMLSSADFETFYKVLPAKEYGTSIPERQNIHKRDLAKTNWFKQTVKSAIDGASS